jgi:PPM family protein phosphatase
VVKQVSAALSVGALNVESLRELLISVDRQMSMAACYGETTCVIVSISNGRITGTSVGDSGAWLILGSTVDNLTALQCRKPFIGSGSAIPICFERDQFQGTLLVASDGLIKYTSPEQIAAAALHPNLDQAARKLIDLVRYSSGALPDDVSVVLARNE